MESITEWWPILSGGFTGLVVGIAWLVTMRVKTDARLQVLEEKVRTLFELWNNRER